MDHNDFMTVGEAAQALAVSQRTIWRYLKSGRLSGETAGEPGSHRTLIPRQAVAELARDRSGSEVAGLLAERDRLSRRLEDIQAERDALRGRVAALQSSLARTQRPARVERFLGGAMAAVARVRVS